MNLLIENVRIVDGNGGEPVEDGAIVVEGRKLAYVGPRAGAPAGGDGWVALDAAGRTVVPGLIDCHVHFAMDEMDVARPPKLFPEGEIMGILQTAARGRRCLENGITTLRDCNAPGYGLMSLRKAFDRWVLPGPRLFLSGQAITATGGHMYYMSFEADGPDSVRKGVRAQMKAGADFIKLVVEASSGGGAADRPNLQLTVPELAAGVETAHRMGKQVAAHAVTREGIADALAAGVDCIEHGYNLADDQIQELKARGGWLVPTLSVHDAILRRGHEVGWGEDRLSRSRPILAKGIETVGRAFRAGLNIACGSDAGSPVNPVWELVPELRLLCEAGLTPGQALEAATRRAAELIGVAAELGTLEAGKLADLVVVEGDPLADVAALGRVAAVVKDGEVVVNRL